MLASETHVNFWFRTYDPTSFWFRFFKKALPDLNAMCLWIRYHKTISITNIPMKSSIYNLWLMLWRWITFDKSVRKHLIILTLDKCENRSTRNETIKFDFQHNGEIKLLLTNHPSLGLNIALIKSGGFQPRFCSRL